MIPFIAISISNSVLIHALYTQIRKTNSNGNQKYNKHRSLAITVIVRTIVFLLMTLPGKIVASTPIGLKGEYSTILNYTLRLLDYSYNSLNPIPLMILNKQIFRELKATLCSASKYQYNEEKTVSNTMNHHNTLATKKTGVSTSQD